MPPKKKPKKPPKKRKRSTRRATVITKNHPPGASPLIGSSVRLEMLRYRACKLHIDGLEVREVGEALTKEFQLVENPPYQTVWAWIQEALQEGRQGNKEECDNVRARSLMRAEGMIRKLWPIATGEFEVERTRVIKGEVIKIIDEQVFAERIGAADQIRKLMEMELKTVGALKGGPEEGKDSPVGAEALKMLVLQIVNNHIAAPGEILSSERQQTVLELRSGDPVVDSL